MKHHFIAFVRTEDGKLIELDGMKKGPVVIQEGSIDLLNDTAKILLKRVTDGLKVLLFRFYARHLLTNPD